MAEAFLSYFHLLCSLGELSKEELLRFKQLLTQEAQKFHLKPILWSNIENTSSNELAKLLYMNYPEKQAWDVTLSIFQQLGRNDLWARAREEMARTKTSQNTPRGKTDPNINSSVQGISNPYRNHMKKICQDIWEKEICLQVPDYFYKQTIIAEYTALNNVFHAQKVGPVTVVLKGGAGSGKSTFLRKVMLEWAAGNFWRDRFRFAFFFHVCELNSVKNTSLGTLIANDFPKHPEMVNEVCSQPERILFIMDGFEELKFDLGFRDNLCIDWRHNHPIQVILSSLLQKKMLPESSLLLALQEDRMSRFYLLLENPKDIHSAGFSDSTIRLYFSHFFQVVDKAKTAFQYMKSSAALFSLCHRPVACWLLCNSIKWQFEIKEDFGALPENLPDLYAWFVGNAFKAKSGKCPPEQNRAQLKSLCVLAAQGTWTQTFVFSYDYLYENGITDSDVQLWLHLRLLQKRGDCFTFRFADLQSFCGALFYFLRQPMDYQNPAIGGVAQLIIAVLVHAQRHLLQVGRFLFGLSAERAHFRRLEKALGFLLSKDVKQEIIQCVMSLSQYEHLENVNFKELFEYLMEMQGTEFVVQVMDLFRELSLNIRDSNEMAAYSFGLKHSRNVKKLHLCVREVFSDAIRHTEEYNKNIQLWQDLCLVFNSKDLQVLDLYNCDFDNTSLGILCEPLCQPVCNLQRLLCSFTPGVGNSSDILKVMHHNPHLKHLAIYGTHLSRFWVKRLCQILQYAICTTEELVLGKCEITSQNCEDIICVLMCNKLKRISLVENHLGNEGVRLLCEALKHPNSVLEIMMLSHCDLSFVACEVFAQALLYNRSLSLLDLGSNFLEDHGVTFLCEALRHPGCNLRELWLTNCHLTPACCRDLAAVLICNQKLKTLKLGNNKIQDIGAKALCEALRHPNCTLQTLDLQECELTPACCVDIASALVTCKTLRNLNLNSITLDDVGLVTLCKALVHPECGLELLGLDKSVMSLATEMVLGAVEQKRPLLVISHQPWVEAELRMRGVPLERKTLT